METVDFVYSVLLLMLALGLLFALCDDRVPEDQDDPESDEWNLCRTCEKLTQGKCEGCKPVR